jgi:ABC-type multidrug transport system fused ATPase/permease subunit
MMTHIARLADFVPKDKRRLFWAVCAAFVVGMITSTLYAVWLGYRVGGYNFQPNWLVFSGWWSYQWAVDRIRDPRPVEMLHYWFFLAGAGMMVFLSLMRYRFVWWPFHPVGFIISGVQVTRLVSFTLLVAWLLKLVMLKFIGPSFYRKSKPFFIGMLTGYILAVAAGAVVDAVWFPRHGHDVHKWY